MTQPSCILGLVCLMVWSVIVRGQEGDFDLDRTSHKTPRGLMATTACHEAEGDATQFAFWPQCFKFTRLQRLHFALEKNLGDDMGTSSQPCPRPTMTLSAGGHFNPQARGLRFQLPPWTSPNKDEAMTHHNRLCTVSWLDAPSSAFCVLRANFHFLARPRYEVDIGNLKCADPVFRTEDFLTWALCDFATGKHNV